MQLFILALIPAILLTGSAWGQSYCPSGGYQVNPGGSTVLRLSDQANIPIGVETRDSVCYRMWLEAGNSPQNAQTPSSPGPTPAPAPSPTPTPEPEPEIITTPQPLKDSVFLSRLTATERNSLNAAIAVNPALSVTVNQLGAVQITSDQAQALFTVLVNAGAVAPERRESILY